MRRRFLFLLAVLSLSGCDWGQYHFVNSIPLPKGGPPDVYVYIGLDGIAHSSAQEAVNRGAFAAPDWKLAKFVTMFPGTSDASWSRLMHSKPIEGYEYEYYDPRDDSIHNTGIVGILKHVMPPFSHDGGPEPGYYKAFDWRGEGYFHGINGYGDTFASAYESLDEMFVALEGQSRFRSDFTAYMFETDMLGHSEPDQGHITRFLVRLSERIEVLKRRHPDQNFHITIMSDHGLDFVPIIPKEAVIFEDEMDKVGIEPVTSLNGSHSKRLFAVTIRHVRVTYMDLRTIPSLVEEVAQTAALIPAVDVTVARVAAPTASDPALTQTEWFSIWTKDAAGTTSQKVLTFGFDKNTNRYLFAPGSDTSRFGITLPAATGGLSTYSAYSDADLFQASKASNYPDLFFRVRTSLSAISVQFPSDILVSLKEGYPSMGNALLGGIKDVARSGFHGALTARGTLGLLLTNERAVPDTVRSDNLLEMFPRLKQRIVNRGVELFPGDAYATGAGM